MLIYVKKYNKKQAKKTNSEKMLTEINNFFYTDTK